MELFQILCQKIIDRVKAGQQEGPLRTDLFSGSEGIQVSRSKSFRELIRNFKSVSEGDYELPAGLDGILRPYQKAGFQWLKTLAAYGF